MSQSFPAYPTPQDHLAEQEADYTERSAAIDAELEQYEIRRVPADSFLYRSYRYNQLSDAIAQAKLERSYPEE